MHYRNVHLGCVCCKFIEPCGAKCPQYFQECTWFPLFFPLATNWTCIPFGQAVTLARGEKKYCAHVRGADVSLMNRGDAAAATWLFFVELPSRDDVAATRTFRGDGARLRYMGAKGLTACLCLGPFVYWGSCPSGLPVAFSCVAAFLSSIQRERIVQAYGIEDSGFESDYQKYFWRYICYCCAVWHQHVFLHEMATHGAEEDLAYLSGRELATAPDDESRPIATQPI